MLLNEIEKHLIYNRLLKRGFKYNFADYEMILIEIEAMFKESEILLQESRWKRKATELNEQDELKHLYKGQEIDIHTTRNKPRRKDTSTAG